MRGLRTYLEAYLAGAPFRALEAESQRVASELGAICYVVRLCGDRVNVQPFFVQLRTELALHTSAPVIDTTVEADGRDLIVVTGATQGGKTVFLRSLGVAQAMMQSGMFVAAEAFQAEVRNGLFTHVRREEDATMTRGKLDEELARLSAIADSVRPNALLLCIESFAATKQREGSEISRQVASALRERSVRVAFVTYLTEFAQDLHERRDQGTLFLRAERRADGSRPFRLAEGRPLETGFGEDVYREVFGDGLDTLPTAPDRGPP